MLYKSRLTLVPPFQMRPHPCHRWPHPFLIIGSDMGRFCPWLGRVWKLTGWIWKRRGVSCTRFQPFVVSSSTPPIACGQGEVFLLAGQLQSRRCAGSDCRLEHHITSKCIGKECKTRTNTKYAASFWHFACRDFSAGSCICILALNRFSWTFLPQCAKGICH